ncbi:MULTISPECIES: hypothetical protein [unclassified Microcoleus]|uniref:hypothetical protein n=1 Tax=unclassified Microcoleus TaxID=2642155 RepID=UPI002FD0D09C
MVFADTLAVNYSRCNNQDSQANAVKFIDYMSSVDTKLWIAFSEDLDSGTPPQRALPAIKAFYASHESSKTNYTRNSQQ